MNRFDSVEEALEELRNGKIILVTDDPDRENDGDLSVRQSLPQQKTLTLWQLMEMYNYAEERVQLCYDIRKES